MKNIFYVIILVVTISVLWGCNNEREDVGPWAVDAFTYHNTLNMPIDIYSYHTGVNSDVDNLIVIYKMRNDQDSIKESIRMGPLDVPIQIILNSDSIRVVFNNAKELWYYTSQDSIKPYNPLVMTSYKLIEEINRTFFYEYHFTQQMYDMAKDIKKP